MFAFLSPLQQFSHRKASANSVFGCLYFPSSELSARLCARPLRTSIGVLVNREGKPVKNFPRAYGKILVRKIEDDGRGSAALRFRSLANRNPKRAIPENHVRFAKKRLGRGKRLRYRPGYRKINERRTDLRAFRRFGGRPLSVDHLSRHPCRPATRLLFRRGS
jgi:hypothetical protein